MTKRIRVENADSGTSFRAVVQVWNKESSRPAEGENYQDSLQSEHVLSNPCDLFDGYIHSGQYLVVKEETPNAPQS